MTISLTTIPTDFGSGGSHLSPNGGTGTPTLYDVLKEHKDAIHTLDLAGGGSGLTAIADQTILGNISGSSAIPVAITAAQTRTLLSVQASTAVTITGGTITGTTIALAPAQLSDGLLFVTGSTGVLTNPTFTGLTLAAAVLKNNLIIGVAGGQVIKGGTAASDPLTITSTGNATKGLINLGDATESTFVFNEHTGASTWTSTGASAHLLLSFSNNTERRIAVFNTTGGSQQSSNIEQRAGTVDYFSNLNSHLFTGTPGLLSQTISGGSGNWLFQMHQATGDFIFQTTTSDTTMLSLTNAGVLTMGATATFQLAAGTLAANGAVATVLSSVGPTGSHTTVQEWMLVKGTAGASRWIPMF